MLGLMRERVGCRSEVRERIRTQRAMRISPIVCVAKVGGVESGVFRRKDIPQVVVSVDRVQPSPGTAHQQALARRGQVAARVEIAGEIRIVVIWRWRPTGRSSRRTVVGERGLRLDL